MNVTFYLSLSLLKSEYHNCVHTFVHVHVYDLLNALCFITLCYLCFAFRECLHEVDECERLSNIYIKATIIIYTF